MKNERCMAQKNDYNGGDGYKLEIPNQIAPEINSAQGFLTKKLVTWNNLKIV